MARFVTIKTMIPVEISANVVTDGLQAHVLDSWIKGKSGEVILVTRFEEQTVVNIFNQLVAEALDQQRTEAGDAVFA